eukprot:scaffold957_cov402-Prasinococcus_capsulatus_cf.AAC.9
MVGQPCLLNMSRSCMRSGSRCSTSRREPRNSTKSRLCRSRIKGSRSSSMSFRKVHACFPYHAGFPKHSTSSAFPYRRYPCRKICAATGEQHCSPQTPSRRTRYAPQRARAWYLSSWCQVWKKLRTVVPPVFSMCRKKILKHLRGCVRRYPGEGCNNFSSVGLSFSASHLRAGTDARLRRLSLCNTNGACPILWPGGRGARSAVSVSRVHLELRDQRQWEQRTSATASSPTFHVGALNSGTSRASRWS